ncbi:hypothetical protein FH972_003421 [Carpinus fangiana]|uniref:Uncharacterized protein n=1 Tax=Carpinus fangiana TaxID=176857 RepID=A0A5N6QHX9_9ROSI|nr:hypothetical protein FH972_003421 [Carpinus fangiana]
MATADEEKMVTSDEHKKAHILFKSQKITLLFLMIIRRFLQQPKARIASTL